MILGCKINLQQEWLWPVSVIAVEKLWLHTEGWYTALDNIIDMYLKFKSFNKLMKQNIIKRQFKLKRSLTVTDKAEVYNFALHVCFGGPGFENQQWPLIFN